MKKWSALGAILLVCSLVYADISSRLNIKTQDGTVNTYPYQARFTNGSVTDNSDGTVSITAGGGSVTLPLPGGATNYIQNTSTLQSGATFYVSSGTVGSFSVNTASATFLGNNLSFNFEIHGSSTTVGNAAAAQTLSVSNDPANLNGSDTVLSVYRNQANAGQEIASFGCNQQIDQFRFFCGQKLSNIFGFGGGDLNFGTGGASDETICTNQSSSHCLKIWESGAMVMHTNNFGSPAPIIFRPNTVEAARFINSGNLGIGTTVPQTKLHISSGNITIDGTGSPTTAQALCLATGGQLGHCTSAVGAGGGCTCSAP